MESIWFFNFSFMPLLIMHDYFSVNWELYFNNIGTFELHTALTDEVTAILKENPYLVAVQGNKQAIITGWQLNDECVLYGRTCNWILTRRVTPSYALTENTAGNMCRELLLQAFYDVPEMMVDGTVGEGEPIKFEQTKDSTTFDAIQSCLERGSAGHEVVFDTKRKCWLFRTLYGEKRSVLLSEENRNMHSSLYMEDCLTAYNGLWYYESQEKDSEGNQPSPIRSYISRDDNQTGIFRWECLSDAETEQTAKQELDLKKHNRKGSAMLRDFRFGVDYGLGDRIILQVKKGSFHLEEEKKIVGVHIWYESDDCGEEPIFN